MPPPPTWVYLRTYRVLPHPTWLSLWESWRRSRLREPSRAYSISGKTLSAQCAHWAPLPKGEARRRAAHVSLPLHPPSSTAPKPSPSGEGGPAKPGRMRGRSVKTTASAKNPTFPPYIRQKSKVFASFHPSGSLFYANFSEYKKSGGLPNFGNPPDLFIDKTPSAWQTGAGCAGFCPG